MNRLALIAASLLLAGCASMAPGGPEPGYGYAAGGRYPGPQGGGGGSSGGVSNPLEYDLEADGNDLLNVGDITLPNSGTPAITRTSGPVVEWASTALNIYSADESGSLSVDNGLVTVGGNLNVGQVTGGELLLKGSTDAFLAGPAGNGGFYVSGGDVPTAYGPGGSAVATFPDTGLALDSGKGITGGLTECQSVTVTSSHTTNATTTGMFRRHGDTLELWVKVAYSGATDDTALIVTLPTIDAVALNVDNTKILTASTTGAVVGTGCALDTGTIAHPLMVTTRGSTTNSVLVSVLDQVGGTVSFTNCNVGATANPFAAGNGDSVVVRIIVPIAEW